MILPALGETGRYENECSRYTPVQIASVILEWLVYGNDAVTMDRDVLNAGDGARGDRAMAILNHVGLYREHKGLLKGMTPEEAVGEMIQDERYAGVVKALNAICSTPIPGKTVAPPHIPEAPEPRKPKARDADFFRYLTSLSLRYDTRIVEDLLLSIKAKQFVILSGGSGTGKTRLAQEYARFSSGQEVGGRPVEFDITLDGGAKSKGFQLSSDTFFGALPPGERHLDGTYRFKVGDVESECDLKLSPRMFYTKADNMEEVQREIDRLYDEAPRKEGAKTKGKLTLWMGEGGGDSDRYAIVPVGSNWTDGRPIVGYMNILTKEYVRTPALDLMLRAQANRSDPYILILDEMNLSHVERYFSDMLSAMESREPVVLDGCDPGSLVLGDNLIVIGTVNMDETTYAFSPKVLDRANVIEFEPASVSEFMRGRKDEYQPSGDVAFLQDCTQGLEARGMGARDIADKMGAGNADIIDKIATSLDSVQRMMGLMGLPFGYRTVDEVMRFMYVAWRYEGSGRFDNWSRYMDSQILERVLPKIHGSISIKGPLEDLRSFCSEHSYDRSATKFDSMVKRLEAQRYVTFSG